MTQTDNKFFSRSIWLCVVAVIVVGILLLVLKGGKEQAEVTALEADSVSVQDTVVYDEDTDIPQPVVAMTERVGKTASVAEEVKVTEETETKVFDCVEPMARYPGGDRALKELIESNLVYPELAAAYGVKGRMIMTFVVDTLGLGRDIKLVKPQISCDSTRIRQLSIEEQEQLRERLIRVLTEESVRVLNLMERWTPCSIGGKVIDQKWYVPVRFQPPIDLSSVPVQAPNVV